MKTIAIVSSVALVLTLAACLVDETRQEIHNDRYTVQVIASCGGATVGCYPSVVVKDKAWGISTKILSLGDDQRLMNVKFLNEYVLLVTDVETRYLQGRWSREGRGSLVVDLLDRRLHRIFMPDDFVALSGDMIRKDKIAVGDELWTISSSRRQQGVYYAVRQQVDQYGTDFVVFSGIDSIETHPKDSTGLLVVAHWMESRGPTRFAISVEPRKKGSLDTDSPLPVLIELADDSASAN